MLNRTIAPPTYLTESISIPKPSPIAMPNGINLLTINEGDVDVCRIDLLFNAGSRYQKQKLQASAALSLMSEGTAKHSSKEISEHFDFWGSFTSISADKDFGRVTAYSLTKHLDKTLEMLEEVIKEPAYPQSELDVWASRGKQSLLVEMEKTSTLARMEFFKSIFGNGHPYGLFAIPSDYDLLNQAIVKEYHQGKIGSQGATIVLSGKINDAHIALVQKHFGNSSWGKASNLTTIGQVDSTAINNCIFVPKPNAVQSAIRVGRALFLRSHPDYTDLAVVNTILGGFFGSRLMKNIREDKGYTYGIGSYLLSFKDSGAFIISTEVGADYVKQTLTEINNEIDRLCNQPVDPEELSLVQQYLMGEALRSFNGPFAVADNIISLHNFNNLDYDFYNRAVHSIKTITPERIMELANKWFRNDMLTICVAGAENPWG